MVKTTGDPARYPLKLRLPTRQVIYGVEFLTGDIEKIASAFRTKDSSGRSTTKPPRRRPARKFDWTDVYLQLLAYIHVHGLNSDFAKDPDTEGWQTAVERWIEHYFEDQAIDCGMTTIREEVYKLIAAIMSEKNSRKLPEFGAYKPT